MQVVQKQQRRTSTTPNATMTTLASPTLGEATTSMWLVEMPAGAEGPVHAFDSEVIWAITEGSATLTTDDGERTLVAGDTVVLPGASMRQFRAGADGFTAVATTGPAGVVTRDDGTVAGIPPWVA